MNDHSKGGRPVDEILLEQLKKSMDENNKLLSSNNEELDKQNGKMLSYTKAIYILTIVIVVFTAIQIFLIVSRNM